EVRRPADGPGVSGDDTAVPLRLLFVQQRCALPFFRNFPMGAVYPVCPGAVRTESGGPGGADAGGVVHPVFLRRRAPLGVRRSGVPETARPALRASAAGVDDRPARRDAVDLRLDVFS